MDGFLCIDKPVGPSSFYVVSLIREHFRVNKVGHCGTLDPCASGLLVLAIGNATKLIPYLELNPKRYSFTIKFGCSTDTLDNSGTVVFSGGKIPTLSDIESVLAGFIGTIDQVPPKFSAKKISGVRAYTLARQNKTVQLTSRKVNILELSLKEFDSQTATASFDLVCSGGTYVRALARDIAAAMGTYGFAQAIRRTTIGQFSLNNAFSLNQIGLLSVTDIIPIKKACANMPNCVVSNEQKIALTHGKAIKLQSAHFKEGYCIAYDSDGNICAVLQKHNYEECRAVRVFG